MRKPLKGDDLVLNLVVRGKAATRLRRLLREEGGTQQYHGLSALEGYITAKGYDDIPEPPKADGHKKP